MSCFLSEFACSYSEADRDARKTFLVPEIIHDPSLFLSPHIFLLAILFRIRAFDSESLNNNPHLLSTLNCHPGSNQLRLTLRDDIGEDFLFRQCVKGVLGYEMDSTRALTQSITGKWIKSIGRQLGFENNTIAYNLRYFAGNSLDQSGTWLSGDSSHLNIYAGLALRELCIT